MRFAADRSRTVIRTAAARVPLRGRSAAALHEGAGRTKLQQFAHGVCMAEHTKNRFLPDFFELGVGTCAPLKLLLNVNVRAGGCARVSARLCSFYQETCYIIEDA